MNESVDSAPPSRRDLLKGFANSFLVFSLSQLAFSRRAMARSIQPTILEWLNEVNELARSTKREMISQVQWQAQMEALYQRIDLPAFLKLIDFETLVDRIKLPVKGETFEGYEFPEIEGVPKKIFFFKELAGFRKGCSIPPHGHNHLVSSFLVLKGTLRGRHFDRLEDEGDFIQVTPTIDRNFSAGEFSTVSQAKNNIHWFTANTDGAFIFDVGVGGLKPTGTTLPFPNQDPLKFNRVYLDMDNPERTMEKTLRVRHIDETSAYRHYG